MHVKKAHKVILSIFLTTLFLSLQFVVGGRLTYADGLKIYNSKDVSNIQLIKQFSDIETYDVIADNHIALVVAKDGLYQYDYLDVNNIHLISKIEIAGK